MWVKGDFGNHYPVNPASFTDTVAIHFGSGRLLADLLDFCGPLKIPIIQGSTKLTCELPASKEATVPIIKAPNVSLPMIRFMGAFPMFAAAIKTGMKVGIVESHQSGKADTSGTARAIAGMLGIPETEIQSVRTPFVQLLKGVPQEHLDGHAYHDFLFMGQGVELRVSTRIHGRGTYAEGALTLAHALVNDAFLKSRLPAGVYELKDIMHFLPKE